MLNVASPTTDMTWQLRQFSIFDHLDPASFESVTRVLHVKEFRKRDPIFLPCDAPRNVYFLLSGRVKVTRTDPLTGREVILFIIRPGELFGLLSRMGEPRANTSAVALQRSHVGYIRGTDFDRLMASPGFALEINRLVGERLVRVATRLDELVFRDVHSRLSRLLLRLADEFPGSRNGSRAIDVTLTQQDLADLIGSTRESANIALNDFRRQGLIDLNRRTIVIRDADRLARIGAHA